jgi:putative hydrolase of the HAD superfamily
MSKIDWQSIDTVLLDMDGTLLDLHFDNYFWQQHLPQRYASIHGLCENASLEQLSAQFESERGSLNWYCLDYWSRQLELDIPALKLEIQHLIAIRPFVEQFLHWLQDNHKQVILVTNAHRDSLNLKMRHTGLERWFDHIVVSHDFRTPKEQQGFWHQLHIAHPFDPQRTLLVDDTESVLRSAQQYGIQHLLTLLQPDSKLAKRQHTEFPGILHFDEIMPSKPSP